MRYLSKINPLKWITPLELCVVFFAALGFLYLVSNFPMTPIKFVYQEI